MKDLQEIKDEYAFEAGFADWHVLVCYGEYMDIHVDEIAIRYAKEYNKELVDVLKQCEQWMGNCNQYIKTLELIDNLSTEFKGSK